MKIEKGITLKILSCKHFKFIFLLCIGFIPLNFVIAQVLKDDAPSSTESQLIEASKQQQIGNPDKAIEILEKLRSVPEVKATVYYQLSKLYYSKSRLEDALNSIGESVNSDPKNKWFRIYQSNIYESIGRYNNAAEAYDALVQLEPENYTYYDLAALNYIKANLPTKAGIILDKAIVKFGVLPQVCIKKSRILYNEKKYKKSIDILYQSLKEYPKHEELYLELFDIYKNQNEYDQAKDILDQFKKINPSHPIFITQIQNISNDTYADDILNKLNLPNPNLDQIIQLIIPVLEKKSYASNEKINIIARKLIERFPNDPKVWALKGDIDFSEEDFIAAINSYKHSTQLGSVPYSVWENLVISLMRMTHWTSLIYTINSALDFYPNQSFLYFALALGYYNLMDFQAATNQVNQFELMCKNNPDRLIEAYIIRAKILDSKGEFLKSEELWQKCMQSKSSDAAYIEYAYSHSKFGKEFSQDLFEKATENKSLFAPYVLSRKAFVAYYQKKYSISLELLLDCLKLKSSRNQENYELAYLIYLGLGDKEKAKSMISYAIEVADNKKYYMDLLNKIN